MNVTATTKKQKEKEVWKNTVTSLQQKNSKKKGRERKRNTSNERKRKRKKEVETENSEGERYLLRAKDASSFCGWNRPPTKTQLLLESTTDVAPLAAGFDGWNWGWGRCLSWRWSNRYVNFSPSFLILLAFKQTQYHLHPTRFQIFNRLFCTCASCDHLAPRNKVLKRSDERACWTQSPEPGSERDHYALNHPAPGAGASLRFWKHCLSYIFEK